MSNDVAQKTTPSVQEPNKHQELLESNHRFVNEKTISYVKTEIIAQTHKASMHIGAYKKDMAPLPWVSYSIRNPQQRLQTHRALGILPA